MSILPVVTENRNKDISDHENIKVTVIIPIRNEEKFIAQCLNTVLAQDFPKENIEVNLIDGMSEDKTALIINTYIESYPFIHMYHNPGKTVPYAMNIGIRNAAGTYIVRLDAHAEYANDYISKCVEYLENTDACNVGGPMIAIGKTPMQKAIAASYHSSFAMGGGKLHDAAYQGYADTVWLGAFKKSTLISVGAYDERFSRSEDDELNYRIAKSGEKIYITPDIKSKYYPRNSLGKLFKQYFDYGLWKPAVIRKHKKPARLSHLVPVSFILFILLFGIAAFFSSAIAYAYFSVLLLYIALDVYYSFRNKRAENFIIKLFLCVVHIVLHISYGIGFLAGIFRFILAGKEFENNMDGEINSDRHHIHR